MTHQAITVPSAIRFQHHDVYDFGSVLSQFQWKPSDRNVIIDFSNCRQANYQALSLYVLYVWWLRMHNHFVKVYFPQTSDVALMWKRMGAMGWSQVLNSRSENFRGDRYKPLFAIRNQLDFSRALKKAETYTHGFNIEYEKTLRYVVSELLYNTLEHGRNDTIPSLIQFNYYREKEELGFIVADLVVRFISSATYSSKPPSKAN